MFQKFRKPAATDAATGEAEGETLQAPPSIDDALRAAEAAQHKAAGEEAAKALVKQLADQAAKARHEQAQRALAARREQARRSGGCGCGG